MLSKRCNKFPFSYFYTRQRYFCMLLVWALRSLLEIQFALKNVFRSVSGVSFCQECAIFPFLNCFIFRINLMAILFHFCSVCLLMCVIGIFQIPSSPCFFFFLVLMGSIYKRNKIPNYSISSCFLLYFYIIK